MALTTHRPAEAAQILGIPASTLRRWSGQFADFLSPPTRDRPEGGGHRRYTSTDIQTLAEVKRLLGAGLTYQQVRQRLEHPAGEGTEETIADALADDILPEASNSTTALVLNDAERIPAEPAASMGELLTNTLYSLSDSQQIILSSQQTSRQLLGVLLQDNFNLKEENTKLRERMLETERKLFELKRDLDEGQARERERMRQMEQYLFDLQRRLDGLASSPTRRAPAPSPPAPAPAPLPTPPADLALETATANPPEATTAEAPLASPPQAAPARKPSLWERLWGGKG